MKVSAFRTLHQGHGAQIGIVFLQLANLDADVYIADDDMFRCTRVSSIPVQAARFFAHHILMWHAPWCLGRLGSPTLPEMTIIRKATKKVDTCCPLLLPHVLGLFLGPNPSTES